MPEENYRYATLFIILGMGIGVDMLGLCLGRNIGFNVFMIVFTVFLIWAMFKKWEKEYKTNNKRW